MPISKTQIDKLGNRLKTGSYTESDLRLLDEYRRSFGEAYEAVIGTIRQRGEFPTGRLAKSTASIAEKLRRESIRLSQMQDIAGCRIVVGNVVQQEHLVEALTQDFPNAAVIDRRDNPSHGYRAIHIVVEKFGKPIEIQIRSSLQHLWAEVSEKSSDVIDPAIKHGGGPDLWRNFLTGSSESVACCEIIEKSYPEAIAAKERTDAAYEKYKKFVEEQLQHRLFDHEANEIRLGLWFVVRRWFQYRVYDHKAKKMHRRLQDLACEMVRIEQKIEELWQMQVRLRNSHIKLLTSMISWLDELKRQKP